MPTKSERVVHIVVRIPPDCDAEEVAHFAMDALTSWGGQLHPDDPLFHSLRVKSMSTRNRKFAINVNEKDLVGWPLRRK